MRSARAKGETIIGLTHFSLVPHMWLEATIAQDFCLDNYQNVAEALADAGMHYVFTGHMHQNDIAKAVSDNGETIYDIQTNSLSGYPNFSVRRGLTIQREKISFPLRLTPIQ